MIRINGTLDGRDGALELDGSEMIFYKKSPLIRSFFGAIGVSLSKGKEFARFPISDIASYDLNEGTFKNVLHITLSSGTQFNFKAGSDLKTSILPALQAGDHVSEGI